MVEEDLEVDGVAGVRDQTSQLQGLVGLVRVKGSYLSHRPPVYVFRHIQIWNK